MKGAETKANILGAALELARLEGLDALSIGRLAKGVGLSKSGLFSHFKSKRALQIQVLKTAAEKFRDLVVLSAIEKPRGEPRLRAMLDNWLAWANAARGGCVFLGAALEYDDRPGDVRTYLVKTQKDWTSTLARAVRIAQQEGHIRPEIDPDHLAFEIYSLMMAFHLYQRLLGDERAMSFTRKSFDRLIEASR